MTKLDSCRDILRHGDIRAEAFTSEHRNTLHRGRPENHPVALIENTSEYPLASTTRREELFENERIIVRLGYSPHGSDSVQIADVE
jgi:hypothetical protein